jgi:uncharacterized damage-inducible protein DinB
MDVAVCESPDQREHVVPSGPRRRAPHSRPHEKARGRLLPALFFYLLAPAQAALASDNPLSGMARSFYGEMKSVVLRAAEKMPDASYGLRPIESVRTFGQIIGHLADAQYLFCSIAIGVKSPVLNIEQSKTSKADLIAALEAAFAYCDKAYDGMTDASAAQTVKLFGGDTPKLGVLIANNMHGAEHYGNLVVYLRLANIVPPTSEPGAHIRSLGAIVAP